MRLLELRAQNFGVFQNRQFEFGDEGLVLVSGPNEAGKSTLLQLVREVLFGFPHSSSYAGDGPMMAEATALLGDGSRLVFRRRKGRANVVEGRIEPDGTNVDEARLAQLLGHTRPALYHNVFAFSLTELGEGANSFKNAELTLTEALFGGSIGGLAHLPKVKRQLREEYDALFKASAKNPPINKLAAKIKEDKKRLKEVSIKPARYQELASQLATTKAEIAVRQEQHKRLAVELAHLQRLDKGWEHFRAAEEVRRQLSTLTVPAALRQGDAQQCETWETTLAELDGQIQSLREALQKVEHQQKALTCEPNFVNQAGAIKRLEHEIGKVEGFLRDLPEREMELAAAESRIAGVLKGLHPDWTIEHLASLRLSLDQRTRVCELIERSRTLATQQASNADDLKTLEETLERQHARLESFVEEEGLDAIPAALSDEAKFSAERAAVRQAEKRIAQLSAELTQLQTRMGAQLPGVPDDLSGLEPPLVGAIEEFRDELAAIEKQQTNLRDRIANITSALHEVQKELLGVEAAGPVPDKALLEAARERRDAGWRLIRRHYIEGQDCAQRIDAWLGDPLESLPEAYVRTVAETDRLADERQQKADIVVKKEHLLSQQALHTSRIEQLTQELESIAHEHAAATARWNALWKPCGVSPQSPTVMLQWLQVFALWQQKSDELREAQLNRDHAQQYCKAFEDRLRAACADASTAIDRLLHMARERWNRVTNERGQRQELARTREENVHRLKSLRQTHGELEQQLSAWSSEWQAVLTELHLPREWKVAAIEQLLTACEQALADERVAQDLRARVGDMSRERDAFERQSRQLAQSLAPELAPLPMVQRVQQLAVRAQSAQETQARATALEEEASRLRLDLAAKQDRQQSITQQRDELWKQVGAKDATTFRQLTHDAARRDQLLDELRSAERALGVAREHEDEAAFLAALASLDRDHSRARQAELADQQAQLAAEMEDLHKSSGRYQLELDQLSQEGDALAVQQAIESHRGQLREHVDRWTSLVLAEKLLERALQEFQREHQDDVLAEAKRILRHLTGGKHVDIRHGVGETFWVVDADGQQRAPEHLSRGTREQLYLAFRLAYVRHYCRDREPLPFVMDDVLVNFEPDRAAATIEVLKDLAQHVQIVFLTCHPTTVDMIKELATCCHIELGSERLVAEV